MLIDDPSACRFRRDIGETTTGMRSAACDSQPPATTQRSGLAHSFVITTSARLTGPHCEAWTSLRPPLAPPHHAALVVSPAPAPDPPPSYLSAFLVRRRVNPHTETHLGQFLSRHPKE